MLTQLSALEVLPSALAADIQTMDHNGAATAHFPLGPWMKLLLELALIGSAACLPETNTRHRPA